jgi:hypothetical protein
MQLIVVRDKDSSLTAGPVFCITSSSAASFWTACTICGWLEKPEGAAWRDDLGVLVVGLARNGRAA